jgi:hypothetical protein
MVGRGRLLLWCAVVVGVLLASTGSAYADIFKPEGGEVTGTGGETKLFSNQIICAKTKFTGKVTNMGTKLDGTEDYQGCLFGLLKVTNFTINPLSLNASETASFRETTIEIERGCKVTISGGGVNLLLKGVFYENEFLKKLKATINVEATEENGLLYTTNKKECGNLQNKEKERTSYFGFEALEGTEFVEK